MQMRIALRDVANRLADTNESVAKVFPAMAGHQDVRLGLPGKWQLLIDRLHQTSLADGVLGKPVDCPFQGINHGIARDRDRRSGHALLQKVVTAERGWRKIPGGDLADHLAVELLGKRGMPVKGTQSRLHVPDRHPQIKPRHRARQSCRGVTMHQDGIDRVLLHRVTQPQQHTARQIGQVLVVLHEVQINVRHDFKE